MSADLLRRAALAMQEDAAKVRRPYGQHEHFIVAVADWLEKSAATYERIEDELRGLVGAPTIEQVYGYDFTEALAVARAYLGESS